MYEVILCTTVDVIILYIVLAAPNKIKVMSSSLSCSFKFIYDMQNYGTVNQSYSINV